MKFIINESKLQKVINTYLEMQNFVFKETEGNYYILESENDEHFMVCVNKKNNICYINKDLVETLSSFFSSDYDVFKDTLISYIKNLLGGKSFSRVVFLEKDETSIIISYEKQLKGRNLN